MWNDESIHKDFRVTAVGRDMAFVTVLREPVTPALKEHAGRKGFLTVVVADGKRIYKEYRNEF